MAQSKNDKTSKKTVEPEAVETETVVKGKKQSSNWGSKLIWGVLFIAIGSVLLLGNLGVAAVDLFDLWKLWPVLIVATGLSVLSLRGWIAWVVYGISALGIIALTLAVLAGVGGHGYSGDTPATDKLNINRLSDKVKGLDLSIEGGLGSYSFASHGGSELVRGESRGQSSKFRYESKAKDDRQDVRVVVGGERRGLNFDLESRDVKFWINDKTPTSLSIDSGASDISADLSKVLLELLDIDTGASSINVKLGSLVPDTRVNIKAGASSVTILVPKDAGVEVIVDGGLSSEKIPEGYVRVNDSTYRSPNYAEAKSKITIDVDMGVSRFVLEETV